jgi:hypothetical protein
LKHLFFHAVYPNQEGQTPFDIAVKSQSPKSVELMLSMFIELSEFRLSKFVRKHFSELLGMGLTVYEKYLGSCMFKHASMKQTKSLKWVFDKDEAFVDFHTSYIGDDFYEKLLNGRTKKAAEPKNRAQKILAKKVAKRGAHVEVAVTEPKPSKQAAIKVEPKAPIVVDEMDLFDDRKVIEDIDDGIKRIEISALEFDWVFHGDSAVNFIKMLANTDNDNLFALQTVRIIVMFLWHKFFHRILTVIFFPFIIYLVTFCVYVTFIFTKQSEDLENGSLRSLDYFFISVVLAGVAYFFSLEVKQMVK